MGGFTLFSENGDEIFCTSVHGREMFLAGSIDVGAAHTLKASFHCDSCMNGEIETASLRSLTDEVCQYLLNHPDWHMNEDALKACTWVPKSWQLYREAEESDREWALHFFERLRSALQSVSDNSLHMRDDFLYH